MAFLFRHDSQFGLLMLAYQWNRQDYATRVRPGLEKGKRDMKRIVKPELDGVPIQEAEGGEWLERWPNLVEFLTATRFSDPPGPRKPGTLNVTTRFKMWAATLKCPNEGIQLRVDARTPELLWDALESLLVTPGTPWEPDPYFKAPASRKKN